LGTTTAAAPRPDRAAGGLAAGLPYLAVSVCLFGGVWPVTKAGLAHATPLWFAFNRAAMAAAAAALLLAVLGRLRWPARADLPSTINESLIIELYSK